MDDLLFGSNEEKDLRIAIVEAKKAFSSSGFELHKICSNLLIPDKFSNESSLLGVIWDTEEDTIGIKESLDFCENSILTKRKILSIIGRIFDPLGLIDPLKFPLRLLFSRIVSFEWDMPVNDEIANEWRSIINQLPDLKQLKIPRYISDQSNLFCFADASSEGIGYVIYLGSNFFFGKSKIASASKTIVDNELLALFELVKMVERIRKILNQFQVFPEIHIYSDSKINLDRLTNSPNKFKSHIGRKIIRIQKFVFDTSAVVHRISGSSNPADIFSRSISASRYIRAKPWFLEVSDLPTDSVPVVSVCAIKEEKVDTDFVSFLSRFASIGKMIRWIERIRRWAPKSVQDRMIENLFLLIRCFQKVSKFSSSHDHFTDHRGLVVYKMRDGINSVWIPSNSALAEILLMEAHRASKHNGLKLSLSQIPIELVIGNANRSMARLIHRCPICRARRANSYSVPFGPSYHEVDVYSGPFSRIAIDGFGPYSLKNGKKYYGLIVACLSTRCLRIGILEDLSPLSAARALNSIFHEVGYPKFILSDNGTNFKPIKLALEKAKMNVVWWTSAPYAPWQNGTAERFVRMVKSCMSVYNKNCRSLYDVVLRFREVESIVNARPIIVIERPISAHEFCFNRPLHFINEINSDLKPVDLNRLYRFNADLKHRFIKILKLRYYNLYRFRPMVKREEVKVGDFVLLSDRKDKNEVWPSGQITELLYGRDGHPRSAIVSFRGNLLRRPLTGLIPICGGKNC